MEFDKSKILTVVTADQAKIGQKGWFGILPKYIQEKINACEEPSVLYGIDLDSPSPFTRKGGYSWPLFYPVPEPTYAERQAQWVKENGVKIGTRVRLTKGFSEAEDGSGCWEHLDAKDTIGVIEAIGENEIFVQTEKHGEWVCPYTALEVIKEPTYRPFKNAEEFKPYRDEWFRVKHDGGMLRICAYNDKGVQEANGKFNTYQIFFEKAERENGEPCGVREDK